MSQEPSPAAHQAQALEDVERIAEAMYRADSEHRRRQVGVRNLYAPWSLIRKTERDRYRSIAHRLLLDDTIRVGRRPETGPQPLSGQLGLGEE